MLNLPLPDSAMAIQAANTDRQTDTDPHMVIVLLLVGTACYVSLYISVTIETYKHCQFVPRASNLLLYPCKFITLLQQQILTFLQQLYCVMKRFNARLRQFFHSEQTLPFFDFDHRQEMKFTYAPGNEFFFGHKLCLAADFAVVLSSVIGRGSDLHRVGFFYLA